MTGELGRPSAAKRIYIGVSIIAAIAAVLMWRGQPVEASTYAYSYTWGDDRAPEGKAIEIPVPANATGLTLAASGECKWLKAALAGTFAPAVVRTSLAAPPAMAPGRYSCTLTVSGAPAVVAFAVVTLNVAPMAFFSTAVSGGGGVLFENLPGSNNLFGYFFYLGSNNVIYHSDLGYESIKAANDGSDGIYMYDFKSGHWWYTNPGSFPFMNDDTLKTWIYYLPAADPGHYSTNPRNFKNMKTGKTFTM